MPARDPWAAARLSGPLPSAAGGRAEGSRRGPWPGPQPRGKEASRQTAAFSRQPAGGAEICQVHVQENKSGDAENAWRGHRSGSRLSSWALLSSLELPPRARARGQPGPLLPLAGTETGLQAAPGSVRAAPGLQHPSARERPGARACLTAVTEAAEKTGNESSVPEASEQRSRLPFALVRPRRLRRCCFGPRMLRCHEPEGGAGAWSLWASTR